MLSAEIALKSCVPSNRAVVFIMDAGFGEDWLKAIESLNWYWLVRIKQGKNIKLSSEDSWKTVKDFIPEVPMKTKSYNDAFIMKEHNHPCRIIITRRTSSFRKKPIKPSRNDKATNNAYRRSAQEPWILATNLRKEDF